MTSGPTLYVEPRPQSLSLARTETLTLARPDSLTLARPDSLSFSLPMSRPQSLPLSLARPQTLSVPLLNGASGGLPARNIEFLGKAFFNLLSFLVSYDSALLYWTQKMYKFLLFESRPALYQSRISGYAICFGMIQIRSLCCGGG